MRKIITTVLTFFVIFTVSAQRSELGLFVGAAYYNGDLNPGTPFQFSPQPAIGMFYRYNFDTRLAIKLGYMQGTLQDLKIFTPATIGNPTIYDNNFISFKTPVKEFSAQFEMNFCEFSIDGENNRISPYIFGGVGLTSYNGTVIYYNGILDINGNPVYTVNLPSQNISNSKKINYEGSFPGQISNFQTTETGSSGSYKGTTVSLPFGIGVKYCPFRNVTTGLEWGIRKTASLGKDQSDNLDGVFTDPYRVSAGNDWYSFIGFWISYRIKFSSDRCY